MAVDGFGLQMCYTVPHCDLCYAGSQVNHLIKMSSVPL